MAVKKVAQKVEMLAASWDDRSVVQMVAARVEEKALCLAERLAALFAVMWAVC